VRETRIGPSDGLEVILVADSVDGMIVMPDTGGIPPVLILAVTLSALLMSATLMFFALRRRLTW
jgi:hypothetical protein